MTTRVPYSMTTAPFNVRAYGARGDNVADDTAAIQAALTAAGVSGGTVYFPAGIYRVTANLTVPVNVPFLNSGTTFSVNLEGAGREQSEIRFSGGAITTGITFDGGGADGSAYKLTGFVRDLQVNAAQLAPTCLSYRNCNMPRIERCLLRGAAGRAVHFNFTIMPQLVGTYITNSGSTTQACVEVDRCTTFQWDTSYISSANASSVAGLRVDGSFSTNITGGAIESCGIPLQIGSKTDTTIGCAGGRVHGVDFERPTGHYIEMGYGCSGSALITGWDIRANTGYPSGAAAVPHAVKLNACRGIRFGGNTWSQPGTPTATHWLEGTTCVGIVVEAHYPLYGFTWPWVMRNGVQVADASPLYDWNQQTVQALTGDPNLTGSTTPSLSILASQGGVFSGGTFVNTTATTVTNLTGGVKNQVIWLRSNNANTTLKHQHGGAGQFRLRSGSDLAMAASTTYQFVYNGSEWQNIG